jgi:SAM-dependent methyltransferase
VLAGEKVRRFGAAMDSRVTGMISCPQDGGSFTPDGGSFVRCEKCGQSFPIMNEIIAFYDQSAHSAELNKQKMFYESLCLSANASKKNTHESPLNKVWAKVRDAYGTSQIDNKLQNFFVSQLEPISNAKVLEIGCYSGTPGTDYCLANMSRLDCYVGIDIALPPLAKLKTRMDEVKATNCYLFNMDVNDSFLNNSQFDLVFGRGILHHFESPERIAKRIKQLLSANGKAVFLEPLNTNLLVRVLRHLSRPLRPNLIWEHPFSSKDLERFVREFCSGEVYYYDALSILSLIFLFNKKMFNFAHNVLYRMDEILSKEKSWYRNNFLRAVIVVSDNQL